MQLGRLTCRPQFWANWRHRGHHVPGGYCGDHWRRCGCIRWQGWRARLERRLLAALRERTDLLHRCTWPSSHLHCQRRLSVAAFDPLNASKASSRMENRVRFVLFEKLASKRIMRSIGLAGLALDAFVCAACGSSQGQSRQPRAAPGGSMGSCGSCGGMSMSKPQPAASPEPSVKPWRLNRQEEKGLDVENPYDAPARTGETTAPAEDTPPDTSAATSQQERCDERYGDNASKWVCRSAGSPAN